MADQHDRALVHVERLDQRLARVDVQVVGRLVEDQHVRCVAGDERQCEARAFAARQLADLGRRLVTRKAEPAELPAHRRRARAAHDARHMLQGRVVGIEFLDLILGEIADPHLARRVHVAFHRRQLRGEQAGQRRLAVAVAAQQRDPVVRVDAQVQPLQDRGFGITDACQIQRDQRRAQLVGIGKVEGQRRVVRHLGDGLHLGQHLGTALCLLGGRGAGRVARDIVLQLGALRVLIRLGGGELRHPLGPLALERVVTARIERHLAALEVQDMVDDIVQEVALVADQQDRRAIGFEEILQPHHRFEVEVVRGFVEQQHVGRGEEQRGQCHAHLPPAGIAGQRPRLHRLVEAQALQDAGGAGGRGIGVDRDQPLIDITQLFGIALGLAALHQLGALDIGGQHRLERGRGAVGRFLRDIAELGALGHFARTVIGFQLSCDHADERRLARAVTTDQADPAAGGECGGCTVEDRAAAQAHGDAVQIEHGARLANFGAEGERAFNPPRHGEGDHPQDGGGGVPSRSPLRQRIRAATSPWRGGLWISVPRSRSRLRAASSGHRIS